MGDRLQSTEPVALGSRFFEWARLHPERAALETTERAHSYGELAERAMSIASTLVDGRGSSDPPLTGVLSFRSATGFAAILAVLRRGHGYVPLNPSYPIARNRAILERSGCDTLVATAESLPVLGEIVDGFERRLTIVVPDPCGSELTRRLFPHEVVATARGDSRDLDSAVTPAGQDPAYLLFTSGSTGTPKGVVVSHANVRSFLDAFSQRYAIGPGDRLSQMFELTFDLSVFDMFAAWDNGACLCSPSARDLLNPAGFIRRSELTIWFSVPSVAMLMQRLRTLKPDTFPSLRLSLFCGEALPWDVAADWQRAAPGSRVENLYGPTEATIACTAYPFDARRARDEAVNGVVPIGLPVGATDVRVVELDSVEEVDVGEDGELLLCGEQVVDGYLDNPEATDRAFVEIDGRRHYRTGDRVRRAGDGEPLVYLGRLDDQIKVLGHRVELGEVEAAVREAAGAPAAAVGWPRTSVGAAGIVAFVADTAADPASIRAQVARRLPDYMVPRELHLIDDLPLNANGKCDRKALLALLET